MFALAALLIINDEHKYLVGLSLVRACPLTDHLRANFLRVSESETVTGQRHRVHLRGLGVCI